jgi:hypothetical protein
VVVLVVSDINDRLDVWHGRGIGLALLHERIVPIPGPGFSAGTVILGLHQISPSIVLNLGRSDKVKAVDGRGTTQDLPARPVELTVVGPRLGDGVIPPVIRGLQQRMCKSVPRNV